MMQTQRGFAEVNGTRLYYEVAGAGPPLVLIHGFSLDTRMWDDQFEAFARQHQVIRYDTRGFGQSALPSGERFMDTVDLKALLEHLGLERADVIGLSRGGGIAIDFALTNPEATHALIVVDSTLGGYHWSQEWNESYAPIPARGRAGDVEGARKLWLAYGFFQAAMENPPVAARLTQIVSDYSGWHWVNPDPGQGAEPPATQRLDQIKAPTLILLGERDVQDIHAIAETLRRGIPRARKVVLPGVGHMANMEAPGPFNEAILSFLAQSQ